MEYGELMLGWHEDWPKLFQNILWSNEAFFHISGFVSRHNCHYWAAHDPEVRVEKMQNRPKVTVWCGMTATRVIGPISSAWHHECRSCLHMLEDYVWPIVSGWENIDELVFMHDGAPPHCTERTCLVGSEVTFSCGAGQRRRFTGENLAQWNNWRTGFGTLSPASHTTSCRRLWMPSPVVWGSWWMPNAYGYTTEISVPNVTYVSRNHL